MNLPRRISSLYSIVIRNASTKSIIKPKFKFELSDEVNEAVKVGSMKARSHVGVSRVGVVHLPQELTEAATYILKDYPQKTLVSDAKKFCNYIWSRHLPLEKDEYIGKKKEIEDIIKEEEIINFSPEDVDETADTRLLDRRKSLLFSRVKKEIYNWKAIDYNDYRAALYITGRLAPDYASLYKVMAEIKKQDPDFSPLTLFDFGSGVGSTTWVVDSLWPEKCKEVVCIDSSVHMNNIADKLLKGGYPHNPLHRRKGGTFFKQFLPMSDTLKYDLVVASRSLFELPDMASRLRTIDVLWRKTSKYLLLVEAGTNAGYKLIQEARDYIMEMSHKSAEHDDHLKGHVFSPCPHDMFCPRFFDGSNTPCNFEVSYSPFRFGRNSNVNTDVFSYVVLKKSNEGDNSSRETWPRVVRPTLCRKGHIICRVCTKFGTLQEYVVTKKRHGKECYQVARNTKWGDKLPIDLPEPSEPQFLGLDNEELS